MICFWLKIVNVYFINQSIKQPVPWDIQLFRDNKFPLVRTNIHLQDLDPGILTTHKKNDRTITSGHSFCFTLIYNMFILKSSSYFR